MTVTVLSLSLSLSLFARYPHQLGHHEGSDKPGDALMSVVHLKPGDIIIKGSDGLFDNLSEEDAEEIANQVRVSHTNWVHSSPLCSHRSSIRWPLFLSL